MLIAAPIALNKLLGGGLRNRRSGREHTKYTYAPLVHFGRGTKKTQKGSTTRMN